MRRVVKAENLECVGRLHGGALYFCLLRKVEPERGIVLMDHSY